jgi:hypothetical protein
MIYHPHPDELLLFVTDHPSLDGPDRARVAAHITTCTGCAEEADALRVFYASLADPSLYAFMAEDAPRKAALFATLQSEMDDAELAGGVADDFVAELLARPVSRWNALLLRRPEQQTYALAERLLKHVDIEMNRRPLDTLDILNVIARIADSLHGHDADEVSAHVWKQRSNAYRHLSRYTESLSAADIAALLYRRLPDGEYGEAQAHLTAAIALFKMTEYQLALDKLTPAITTLHKYGVNLPLIRALILQANIFVEQGDMARALPQYRSVLPLLNKIGDRIEEARVLGNLADCSLRAGDYETAIHDATLAVDRYEQLRMEAEAVRATWTLHLAQLKVGDLEALDRLHITAAAFEVLSMLGEAGFVRLDITEELLRIGDWEAATPIARALVDLFTRARVTLAQVEAIDQLRRAVEKREATPDFVRQVRAYVEAENPAIPFTAPRPN